MEKVYVENDWYDGPRKGIADFNGKPHRFISNFEDVENGLETFRVFPVTKQELDLEVEQWKIFVEWNNLYESGKVDSDSHPGHGGINKKWDEIEEVLGNKRDQIPETPKIAYAAFESNGQENRYEITGPCYGVTWEIKE